MTHPILLFDFGGVLVDLDRERVLSAFARLGMDIAPLLGTFKQAGVLSQLESGKIDVPTFCHQLRELTHQPDAADQDIVEAWRSYLATVPTERLDMLLRIKQHYAVNLLSNTNIVHWQMAEDALFAYNGLGVSDFFDHVFLSFQLGAEKPAPEVFEKVAAGLGVAPSDVLFLDDSLVNCEAARACGFHALVAGANSDWLKYFDTNGKLLAPYLPR